MSILFDVLPTMIKSLKTVSLDTFVISRYVNKVAGGLEAHTRAQLLLPRRMSAK